MFVNSLYVSVTAAEVTNPKRPFIASLFAPFPCQPPSDVTDEHSFNSGNRSDLFPDAAWHHCKPPHSAGADEDARTTASSSC